VFLRAGARRGNPGVLRMVFYFILVPLLWCHVNFWMDTRLVVLAMTDGHGIVGDAAFGVPQQ